MINSVYKFHSVNLSGGFMKKKTKSRLKFRRPVRYKGLLEEMYYNVYGTNKINNSGI